MIFDKLEMFLDGEAFGATPAVIDFGPNARAGLGEPLKIALNCGGEDMAGLTDLTILTGDTDTPDDVAQVATCVPDDVNGKVFFTFVSPSTLGRYMTIALTAASAGTLINCGIVLDAQSNE